MTPNPPTYPARPVNGGPLPQLLKYPRPGKWAAEPKANGWRSLVHAPTGTMFNRHGERLSIASEFKAALTELWRLELAPWVDCEAFERRHPLGRGCLVVLDLVIPGGYEERRRIVAKAGVPIMPLIPAAGAIEDKVVRLPTFAEGQETLEAWDTLQQANVVLGCEFYEGLVLKRSQSGYNVQLRSPEEEAKDWVKARWRF
jgi:hypothetical protein